MPKFANRLNIALVCVVGLLAHMHPASAAADIHMHWPVKGAVTAKFQDKSFPFAQFFPLEGIDIQAAQNTEVKAAINGTVTEITKPAKHQYSHITIVGKDGLTTIYGDLHKVDVKKNQEVKKGEVIGRSGGFVGTKGVGYFSTGPHLYFEVRLDGVPVNPLNYLPN